MARINNRIRLEGGDLAVVKDVVRFGWMATDQIARRYGLPPNSAPAQLKRLCREGLLRVDGSQRIAHGDIYVATRLGALGAGVGLAAVDVDRIKVHHHLTVIDVADYLLADEPGSRWLTERELVVLKRRHAHQHRGSGQGHDPDGMLISANRQHIAIEVELNEKTWEHYAKICRWYAEQIGIDGLRWYVNVPRLLERLPNVMRQHGFTADLGMTVQRLPTGVEARR